MSVWWMTGRAAGLRASLCAIGLLAAACGDDTGGASDAGADDAAQGQGDGARDAAQAAEGDAMTPTADDDAGTPADAGEDPVVANDAGTASAGPCAVLFTRDDSNRVASGTDIVTGCSAAAFGGAPGPSQINFGAQDMAGDVLRMFKIDWFDAARDAGTEIDLAQPYDYQTSKGIHASYVELGQSDKSPLWLATSGKVRIARVTGSEYVVELDALQFEPDAEGASGSSGSFEVHGTITATLE